MNNGRMSDNYAEQANNRLPYVRQIYADGHYAITVREAQEVVELFLKAALRAVGVEHAKTHDVELSFIQNDERFPDWFAEEITEIAIISREMAEDRGPAFYGDEERLIPAEELFGEPDATEAVERMEKVARLVNRLIDEIKGSLNAG